MEVLAPRLMSPTKTSSPPHKPSGLRSNAPPRAKKIRIRHARSPGSPGSSHASADGIAITSHLAQRLCAPAGTSSPPWQLVMVLRSLNKMRESRSLWGEGWGEGVRGWVKAILFVGMLIHVFVLIAPAHAVQPDEILPDAALEGRARALSRDLRCMVC